MKTLLGVILVLIIGTVAIWAMNKTSEHELTLRYKITVNVETPQGLKSGYAVREILIDTFNGYNPDKADFNAKVRGEAAVIDIDKNIKLFALIHPNSYTEMLYAFPIVEQTAPLSLEGMEYYRNLKEGASATLDDTSHWPRIVTFENLDSPSSIKMLLSSERDNKKINDIEQYLGSGSKIKDINIEITNQPITFGKVKNQLKWFREKKLGLVSFDAQFPEPEHYLTTSDFTIGEEL